MWKHVWVLSGWFFRRYLFSRRSSALVRRISWISIFGIGLGTAALTIVLSIMNGFDGTIRSRLLGTEPHLLVFSQQQKKIEAQIDPLISRWQTQNPLQNYSPYTQQDILIRTSDGRYGGAVLMGVNNELLQLMINQSRSQSNTENQKYFFSDVDRPESKMTLGAREIMVGVDLAYQLQIFEGDTVTLLSPELLLRPQDHFPPMEKMLVKALLRTNIPEKDSGLILYNVDKTLGRLRNSVGYKSGVAIRWQNPEDFGFAIQDIQKLGLEYETWAQRHAALFYSLKMEKIAMSLFLGLSIFIASFTTLIVLALLLTHKKIELGTLMAIGLSEKNVVKVFTLVGVRLALIGTTTGLLFGLALCFLIDRYPIIKLPDIYYDTQIPIKIDPSVIFVVFFASLLVGLILSWLPIKVVAQRGAGQLMRPFTRPG